MKKFVAMLLEEGAELTEELLSRHVAHLRRLTSEGRLVLCGPLKEKHRALMILAAHSMEEAEALVKQDPFINEKFYQTYEISELIEANESNNWLC